MRLAVVAQLCQGSLGDPLVKITFGAGSNPGPPLAAGITNYTYYPADCPNDGYYTIRNATSSCFSNTWVNIPSDHTGDPNGYFMLVNASIQPNDFYVDTVRGLCGGTTFEFSSWIMSILKTTACGGTGIQPNMTFYIEKTDKTVLASYNTGDISSSNNALWLQYGFYFTTPAGVNTVVLRMKNNAPGGCGNDLALDDITFRPCGPTIQIGINGASLAIANSCFGKPYTLALSSNVSAGYNLPVYQWQQSNNNGNTWIDIPSANNSSFTAVIPTNQPIGTYLYRLGISEQSNAGIAACKVISNIFQLIVNPYPTITIGANTPICEGGLLQLQGPNNDTCVWAGPAGYSYMGSLASLGPVTQDNAGYYYLTATSAAGCATKDTILITINPKPVAHARADTAICSGDNIALQGSGAGTYVWKPTANLSDANSADPISSPTATTRYLLTVTNLGCTDTTSVLVQVLERPTADAGPDKHILQGTEVQLNGAVTGNGISYYWTPSNYLDNDTSIIPLASPPSDITYTLHVTSNNGCGTATDDVLVTVFKKLTVPNAFSPNGDGINDFWNILYLDTYIDASVLVFDRYGRVVFESKGYTKPWDGTFNGKPVPVGTYYYIIDTKTIAPKLNGSVFLIR